MVRRSTVTPKGYPTLQAGKSYPAIVCDIEKKTNPLRFEMLLRNLYPSQDGCEHVVVLPLPVLPNNSTARFFRAVGLDVRPGKPIAYEEAKNKRVAVWFALATSGKWEAVSFEPVAEETKHVADPE